MSKGGIYSLDSFIAIETKIVTLMRRIEVLESAPQIGQLNQLQTLTFVSVLQIILWRNVHF